MSEEQSELGTRTSEVNIPTSDSIKAVGSESEAREELYFAKAINGDGLPVSIVGIEVKMKYTLSYYRYKGTRHVNNATVKTVEDIESKIKEFLKSGVPRMLGSIPTPHIDLYFETPYNKTYKVKYPVHGGTGRPCLPLQCWINGL